MEGEVVRDSVLFLAGRLDPKIGGPELPVAAAETGTRRTIYYRYASGDNIPLLTMFDAANVTECYRRDETIVPQQALALINSGMVLDPRRRDRGGHRQRGRRSDPSVAIGASWTRLSSAFSAERRPTASGPSAWRASSGWPRRSRSEGTKTAPPGSARAIGTGSRAAQP